MSNIFRSELIMPYRKSAGVGTGEISVYAGENAIVLKPAPFYQNLNNGTRSAILDNEIQPNTQYLIDMWINADDAIYNDQYRSGGLVIYYDDGTSTTTFRVTGGDGVGFQHKRLITPAGKTISRINVYYGYNLPIYYRWDSCIVPITSINTTKQGQLNHAECIENQNIASLSKSGVIYTNNIYEY